MKSRGPLSVPRVSSTHRTASKRICNAATALLAFTLCLAAAAPSALGQNPCPQPPPVPASAPLHTMIPVHFDPVTGAITVGSTTYCGGVPESASAKGGFHLLALSRQPDPGHLDAPDVVLDQTLPSGAGAALVNNLLNNISKRTGGPIVMVNAVGNYGILLSAIAPGLTPFGSYGLKSLPVSPPFIFIGNAGRAPQTALQRGNSTLPLNGYLVQDSNGNYTFTQIDFVHYDMTTEDGTIKVGSATYTVAGSHMVSSCNGQNAFHLLKVVREAPNSPLVNNTYCTAQSDSEIQRLVADLNLITTKFTDPTALYFLVSNGHPIPADWSFGTDGDARFYPLAQEVAKLGGYFETMVYLTPNDTYSLVGAVPFTPQPRPRAKESSSVYPADVNGNSPTGELHGVLARGVGNWYNPLNADPTGTANLQLYNILGQAPVAFPHPNGSAEVAAFQFINKNLCGSSTCNVRNQYGNLDIDIVATYEVPLESLTVGPSGTNCTNPQNAGVAYCVVRAQLLKEFIFVSNIRDFYDNVTSLWDGSGGYSLAEQLGAYQKVLATIPKAPTTAPAPSLVKPLVDLFLGLGHLIPIPRISFVFGLADVFFNFGTSLTTDPKGNPTINLTSTIGELDTQAANQFIGQAYTTGTLFEFIYQDWGKMSALGKALASGDSSWSWSPIETAQMLQAMGPAIQQAAYRSIMPSAYAIGSYLPQSNDNCGPAPLNPPEWGQTPLWLQTWSYGVLDAGFPCPGGAGVTAVVQPFNSGWGTNNYIPYTYPTDTINPYYNDPRTGTILADDSWLGISALGTDSQGGAAGHYNPPDWTLLSTLFTPVSQGGLGVYRPAFFEGWPFPRITCALAYNVYSNGGSNVGGCNWPAVP